MVFVDHLGSGSDTGNEYSYLTILTTKMATSVAQNLNRKPIEYINFELHPF